MVNLVIMRHGEAEPMAASDKLRPLTPKGVDEVTQMANWLYQQHGNFDWVWSSPYLRTQQTAELMLAKQPSFSQLDLVTDLVPDANAASFQSYLDVCLATKPDARILLVSHMPLVSFLVAQFTDAGQAPVFSPAQLACIAYQPKQQGQLIESISTEDLALLSL
ncbi:phosphohistidine phosphatase SixA [Rheinheimera salexigens]|uniref:Phosphohistidine phosphatase SixA n=2 Tax=Rheinheimera salexigens TaxID=1628148 RepID=A0A1E7QA88_9GAMM|nr:phosphohistidine phosphatase SixA [Rheinheimera salexigens]